MAVHDRDPAQHRPGGPHRGHAARLRFLAILTVVVLIAAAFMPRVAQHPLYHLFADTASFCGIPNFLNIFSNLPLLLAGAFGLGFVRRARSGAAFMAREEFWPYLVFFLGVMLTGLGSMYYHHAPDNDTLVWDRLPMTLGFMGLLSAMIAERIDVKLGVRLLPPLAAAGATSVLYWSWTEAAGEGDLRAYLLVQGYGILLIVLIAALFRSRYTRGGDIFLVAAVYIAALVFERLDFQIYSLGNLISGHSIKHLVAGFAAYWVLRNLRLRRPAGGGEQARKGSDPPRRPQAGGAGHISCRGRSAWPGNRE